MNSRTDKTGSKAVTPRAKRRTLLTDPMGIVLLLGSTAAMMAVALFKARGLPFQRPRGGAPRR